MHVNTKVLNTGLVLSPKNASPSEVSLTKQNVIRITIITTIYSVKMMFISVFKFHSNVQSKTVGRSGLNTK